MHIYHNSHDTNFRTPFGAALCGSEVHLRLEAPEALSAKLRLYTDDNGETLISADKSEDGSFSWTIQMPENDCILWYFFVIQFPDIILCYGNNPQKQGGEGKMYLPGQPPESFQISVYHPFTVPKWYKEGIAYQIFPDRFRRTEGTPDCGRHMEEWDTIPYYIRNEDGSIREWNFWGGTLRGITEKLGYISLLGASVIYLNPIFAARSNHRYDTADYMKIDPMLGTEEDFRELCGKAKELGIRIILDGVFNHTGVDSQYFREHPDWYLHDENGIKCWWGVKDLPEIDETVPEYVEFICGENGVLRYWLRAGASGWRLDVADELPDQFMRQIRAAVRAEDPDAVVIGEVWEDASNKIDYGVRMHFFGGEELDSVMNYTLRTDVLQYTRGEIDAAEFAARQISRMENYPPEAFYGCFNCIGSHDRERILTLLGSVEAVKFASTIQYAMPGIPVLYYGDEVGLEGGPDPDNRRSFPWGRKHELLEHYRELGLLRNGSRALKKGDLSVFAAEDGKLVVRRSFGAETVDFEFDQRNLKCEITRKNSKKE